MDSYSAVRPAAATAAAAAGIGRSGIAAAAQHETHREYETHHVPPRRRRHGQPATTCCIVAGVFQPAASPDALFAPEPRWLARRQFATWTLGPSVIGWSLWGHVGDDDAEDMKQLWLLLVRRIARPYDFVLDLRRLASVSSGAYARIREFAIATKPGLARQALIVGDDQPGGTIQLGLYVLRPPAHAWRRFADHTTAAAWLERAEVAGVDAHTSDDGAVPAPLAELRAVLARAMDATIESAASALARSPRTLQRQLAEVGTTFSDEIDRVRVLHAQELLRAPDCKLDATALAIGCADGKSLNRLFRRVTGETATEFRRRVGGA
jgi:AraC-like DNA-binding protein